MDEEKETISEEQQSLSEEEQEQERKQQEEQARKDREQAEIDRRLRAEYQKKMEESKESFSQIKKVQAQMGFFNFDLNHSINEAAQKLEDVVFGRA